MKTFVVRLIEDERGQDLIEYVLLTVFVGFAGIAAFPLIEASIQNAYGVFNSEANDLWNSPDPAGGS